MSSTTRVVHVKKEPYDIYIGRWNPSIGKKSKFANPFKIGKDGSRDEVIAKYRAYIMSTPELIVSLPELRGKTLGCWCAPERCHGDVLIELLSEYFYEDGLPVQ